MPTLTVDSGVPLDAGAALASFRVKGEDKVVITGDGSVNVKKLEFPDGSTMSTAGAGLPSEIDSGTF